MAATISKEKWLGNKLYLRSVTQVIGTGAPADTDAIVTNVQDYPIGTEYIDTTNRKVYKRVAITPDADDYVDLTATA